MAIHYIRSVSPRRARGDVRRVYQASSLEFGAVVPGDVVEPIALHSALPPLLAVTWRALRETVLVCEHVKRHSKELVAVAVSESNSCPWCAQAHSIMLSALGRSLTDEKESEKNEEGESAALYAWAGSSRFAGSAEKAKTPAPFSPEERAELVGTALMFHYINRPVSVLLDESPAPVQNKFLSKIAGRLAAWRFGKSLALEIKPGPAGAEIQSDSPRYRQARADGALDWAFDNLRIQNAWLAFRVAAHEQFEEYMGAKDPGVAGELTAALEKILQAWTGAEPPLGGDFTATYLSGLPENQAAALRLMITTALAPYRVHPELIKEFRRHYKTDEALLATLVYSSLEAALSVGRRLG